MKGSLIVAGVLSLQLFSIVTSSQDIWKHNAEPTRIKRSPARGGGFNGGASIPGRGNRTNVISDTLKAGAAVSNRFPNLTPAKALSVGKEALIGSPEKIAVNGYSDTCERIVKNGGFSDHVDGKNLGYALLTEPQAETHEISVPQFLYIDHRFNNSHSVVIFVDDYMSNINKSSDARDALLEAYKARGDVDFIVVDTSTYFEEPYPQAAFNTQKIGYKLGVGLLNMVTVAPLDKIHLIGYGLGAQTVGRAAEIFTYFLEESEQVQLITGLDPANPCFGEGEQLEGLKRGYARFVEIIHTNSDVFGKGYATGDADYYPNGEIAIQPGCFTSSCSHHRAWEYYAESVYPGQENNFMAQKCESLRALNEGLCTKYPSIPMGFASSKGARGKYFLNTNGRAPYGKNQS